jgi:hypothetical protein
VSYIGYGNQGATRSLPLSPELAQALGFLQEMGLRAHVFSGGQAELGSGGPRTGSTRHDRGHAADVFFYRGDERLNWANPEHVPIFQDVVRRGRAAGLTGFGAGPGYMPEGSMHVGFGAPAVWGAGGRGENAPAWLREAFGGATGGPAGPAGMAQGRPMPGTGNAPTAGAPMQAPDFDQMPPEGLGALFAAGLPGAMQAQRDDRNAEQERNRRRRRELLLGGAEGRPQRGGLPSLFGV